MAPSHAGGGLDVAVAALMALTAVGSGAVLLVGDRRCTHRDVHLLHLAMGVVMVGLLAGIPRHGWTGWTAVMFVVPTAWFGARAVSPATRFADLQHAVASLAMVVMLAAMAPVAAGGRGLSLAPTAGGGSMAGHAMGAGSLDPSGVLMQTLVGVVVLCVLVDARRLTRQSRAVGSVAVRAGLPAAHARTVLVADFGMALAMGLMVLGVA